MTISTSYCECSCKESTTAAEVVCGMQLPVPQPQVQSYQHRRLPDDYELYRGQCKEVQQLEESGPRQEQSFQGLLRLGLQTAESRRPPLASSVCHQFFAASVSQQIQGCWTPPYWIRHGGPGSTTLDHRHPYSTSFFDGVTMCAFVIPFFSSKWMGVLRTCATSLRTRR
jgi:hypothetical protein